MKLYIEKETKLNGDIRYYVMCGGKCMYNTTKLKDAEAQYEKCLKSGVEPKTEIIKSTEI